jgi:hypothetical protein
MNFQCGREQVVCGESRLSKARFDSAEVVDQNAAEKKRAEVIY